MSIKPILFNTDMMRAILDGRKTVTRRVVKPQPMIRSTIYPNIDVAGKVCAEIWGNGAVKYINQPYHRGDILWVRETFRVDYLSNIVGSGRVHYKADGSFGDLHFQPARYDMLRRALLKSGWRPNENMPREAARIWLRVTDVRVERLHDMTDAEISQEGVSPSLPPELQRKQFGALWDSTIRRADIGRYGWNANPWVWRTEFERCEKPEAVT